MIDPCHPNIYHRDIPKLIVYKLKRWMSNFLSAHSAEIETKTRELQVDIPKKW